MAGPVVHTYRAAESGLYVNSYLVEGESGVVVVDTNLLVSDIEALRARLRALKKPLPFDKDRPFKNLGIRVVDERGARQPLGIRDVELTLQEFGELNGVQQIMKGNGNDTD